tara:strand:- start:8248 stop:8937 length:690 start_codon:yes stop_codon:yes gene_type:complete
MNSTQNFFDSLYADSDVDDDDENVCLITGETLLNDHITLPCNHKFNYESIFNEIKKQKRSFFPNSKFNNYYEIDKVKKYQIKCPYCRRKFDGLLPPSSNPNFQQLLFVNFPYSKCIMLDKCKYTFLSGKRKGFACSKSCNGNYCSFHKRIMNKREKALLNKVKKKTIQAPCNHILTRGPRKGEICGKKSLKYTITPISQFCKAHEKWSVNYKKKPVCIPVPQTNNVVTI